MTEEDIIDCISADSNHEIACGLAHLRECAELSQVTQTESTRLCETPTKPEPPAQVSRSPTTPQRKPRLPPNPDTPTKRVMELVASNQATNYIKKRYGKDHAGACFIISTLYKSIHSACKKIDKLEMVRIDLCEFFCIFFLK